MDAGIIAIQRNVVTFIQGKLSAVWDLFWTKLMGARPQTEASAPASTPPQLAWLFSTDAWRSAMSVLKPAAAPSKPPTLSGSRHNSNVGTPAGSRTPSMYNEAREQAPSFPVPQHYE